MGNDKADLIYEEVSSLRREVGETHRLLLLRISTCETLATKSAADLSWLKKGAGVLFTGLITLVGYLIKDRF